MQGIKFSQTDTAAFFTGATVMRKLRQLNTIKILIIKDFNTVLRVQGIQILLSQLKNKTFRDGIVHIFMEV